MFGSTSTGMPRPSSATVIEPSGLTVTWITVAWPPMTSSIELSTTSLTRWCSPAGVAISDVHARALADVLQIAHIAHLIGAVVGRLVFRGIEFVLCIQIPLVLSASPASLFSSCGFAVGSVDMLFCL